MSMTMAFMLTHIPVFGIPGIGDLPIHSHGDGECVILIGDGAVRGMPDGMTHGIIGLIGIIIIGELPDITIRRVR